jgi:hypothetical protein
MARLPDALRDTIAIRNTLTIIMAYVIIDTNAVQINATDWMAKHSIKITEGARRLTNANLNLPSEFVKITTLVVQTNAKD